MSLSDRIIAVIARHPSVDPGRVMLDADFIDDLNCDDIDQVEIVLSLEDAFGIVIDDSDMERMRTVGDAVQMVEAAVHAKARIVA